MPAKSTATTMIEGLLKQNPSATAKEAIAAVRCDPNLFYAVRSRMRREGALPTDGHHGTETAPVLHGSETAELIIDVKRLAKRAGGMTQLCGIVAALAE